VHLGHLAIPRCSMARLVFGIPASRSDKDVLGLVWCWWSRDRFRRAVLDEVDGGDWGGLGVQRVFPELRGCRQLRAGLRTSFEVGRRSGTWYLSSSGPKFPETRALDEIYIMQRGRSIYIRGPVPFRRPLRFYSRFSLNRAFDTMIRPALAWCQRAHSTSPMSCRLPWTFSLFAFPAVYGSGDDRTDHPLTPKLRS